MTYRVIVRPLAENDLRWARKWYERQRTGLGDEFLECVEETLTKIAERPHIVAILYGDVRRAATRRFPYGVFYRIMDDVVHVIGVFHGRRSPRAIRRRN